MKHLQDTVIHYLQLHRDLMGEPKNIIYCDEDRVGYENYRLFPPRGYLVAQVIRHDPYKLVGTPVDFVLCEWTDKTMSFPHFNDFFDYICLQLVKIKSIT